MERSAAQGSRMVYAQAADPVAGGGSSADFAVVASGGGASGAVLVDDRKIPGTAGAAGVGSCVSGTGAVVRGCGVARLPPRAWESAECGEHGFAAFGADDDDARLGSYLVEAVRTREFTDISGRTRQATRA